MQHESPDLDDPKLGDKTRHQQLVGISMRIAIAGIIKEPIPNA
jgi:hypothetical protein